MKLVLSIFLLLTLTIALEIPLPAGTISEHPVFGPLNYEISNQKLKLIDPSLGLTQVIHYRISGTIPDSIPVELRTNLNYLLKAASTQVKNPNPGELLITVGNNSCGSRDIRLTVLVNGDFSHLIDSSDENPPKFCCINELNGHYGTQTCNEIPTTRTLYLITHGETYLSTNGMEKPFDPPLSQRGIHQALQLASFVSRADLVISSTDDASSITGAIISHKLGVNHRVGSILNLKCGRGYEMWRLLNQVSSQSDESVLSLLGGLPSHVVKVILVVNPEIATQIVHIMNKEVTIRPATISQLEIHNSTGRPYFSFIRINNGSLGMYPMRSCNPNPSSPGLDIKLLDGSEVDYTLARNELNKYEYGQQSRFIRLTYERRIWSELYWEIRYLFRTNLIREVNEVRYWGNFPTSQKTTMGASTIGKSWAEFILDIWVRI